MSAGRWYTPGGSNASQVLTGALAGWTFVNPSNIATGAPTLVGSHARFVTQNPGTASPLPTAWAGIYTLTKNIRGVTQDVDLNDLARLIARTQTAIGSAADIRFGAVLYNGGNTALAAGNRAIGCGAVAVAGQWVPFVTNCTGAGFTSTDGTGAAAVIGGELCMAPASATQPRSWAVGVDNATPPAQVGGTVTANSTPAVQDNLDTLFLGFGWNTGIGGTGGNLDIKPDLIALKLVDAAVAALSP